VGVSYRGLSLWLDTLPEPLVARPRLDRDVEVDVAIVGAGYTGLWTAYHLSRADPSLTVAVVEREIAGFGASGRNGGWCVGEFAAHPPAVARRYGEPAARAMIRALAATVDEVGEFCRREDVDAEWAKGGTITLARSAPQERRLRAEVEEDEHWGIRSTWLSASETAERLHATEVSGARWSPDCAALNPGKLVRSLADVVTARGVALYEQTPALSIAPHEVRTPAGTVRAAVVVRATEGFTPALPGHRRVLAPVYSLMIATEPLADRVWDRIGWSGRETLADGRHLIIYAQRTADGRIAFGGRGAPYHLRSAVRPAFDRDPTTFALLRRTMVELFPDVADARITHRWGGPLGVPRDWFPSVGLDRSTGLGWGGGYVGEGVAASALAGQTLAELVTGQQTVRTALPWVNHHSRSWEPEPLRWAGVSAGLTVMTGADRAEHRTGRSSKRAAVFDRLVRG